MSSCPKKTAVTLAERETTRRRGLGSSTMRMQRITTVPPQPRREGRSRATCWRNTAVNPDLPLEALDRLVSPNAGLVITHGQPRRA